MIAAAMGWIGTLGTISAYVMLSRGYVHATSLRYATLNCLGGLLGAAGSAVYGAWPSVASNLIWSAVALQSIVVTLRQRRVHLDAVVEQLPVRVVAEPVAQPMYLTAA